MKNYIKFGWERQLRDNGFANVHSNITIGVSAESAVSDAVSRIVKLYLDYFPGTCGLIDLEFPPGWILLEIFEKYLMGCPRLFLHETGIGLPNEPYEGPGAAFEDALLRDYGEPLYQNIDRHIVCVYDFRKIIVAKDHFRSAFPDGKIVCANYVKFNWEQILRSKGFTMLNTEIHIRFSAFVNIVWYLSSVVDSYLNYFPGPYGDICSDYPPRWLMLEILEKFPMGLHIDDGNAYIFLLDEEIRHFNEPSRGCFNAFNDALRREYGDARSRLIHRSDFDESD